MYPCGPAYPWRPVTHDEIQRVRVFVDALVVSDPATNPLLREEPPPWWLDAVERMSVSELRWCLAVAVRLGRHRKRFIDPWVSFSVFPGIALSPRVHGEH